MELLTVLDALTPLAAFGGLALSVYTFIDRRRDPARAKQRETRTDVRALVAAARADVAAAEDAARNLSGERPANLFSKHRPAFSDLQGRLADPGLVERLQWLEVALLDVSTATSKLHEALRDRQREQPSTGDEDPAVTVAVSTTELRQATKKADEELDNLTRLLNDVERRLG